MEYAGVSFELSGPNFLTPIFLFPSLTSFSGTFFFFRSFDLQRFEDNIKFSHGRGDGLQIAGIRFSLSTQLIFVPVFFYQLIVELVSIVQTSPQLNILLLTKVSGQEEKLKSTAMEL